MGILYPGGRAGALTTNVTSTTVYSTTITAHATPHTKGLYGQLIASTAEDAYGIFVMLGGSGVSATATDWLVDISTGAALSETVIVPNLMGGWAEDWGGGSPSRFVDVWYYFPLFVKAGTRVAARGQALITVDILNVTVWLFHRPRAPLGFIGTKVTDYGVNTGASGGTQATAGNAAFGSTAQLSASTSDPIKYLQIGMGGGSDTTLSNVRVLAKLMLGTTGLVTVPCEVAGSEAVSVGPANSILSQMQWNIPSGKDLGIQTQMNSATNNVLDFAVYGVS